MMNSWVVFFLGYEPSAAATFLAIYGFFVLLFTASNFAGHAVEIIGGVNAAWKIFQDALTGTLQRPFRWWDANPPGRVLNRFSEDVNVMDNAITNILGVIFGAVLYFVSHLAVLSMANPYSLLLLPFIAVALEFFAKYYRTTVREVQRMYLVSMSAVYQEMVEAVVGQVTIRAFAAVQQTLCSSIDGLDRLQRIGFAKVCVVAWIGLRMDFIGYSLSMFNVLYPVMQFYGLLQPHSAALVGFSISYSQDVVNILKQMIMNFSELEMQLISVERLTEYSQRAPPSAPPTPALAGGGSRGLQLADVAVTYREGLPPALSGVSLAFPLGEAAAIMGRTGAGKSSLLLSVMQLVPYTGRISVCGELLGQLDGEDVRSRLVGVVPQQPALFEGSLRWNMDPKGLHADAELWDALQAVGLRAACSAPGLGAQVATSAGGGGPGRLALSQGQRQLLCAARALLRRPRVAMLDEVSASLPSDVAASTVQTLLDRFKQRGAAVLLVTHQQESCCRSATG
ncbi:unnamed protein product [Prorocentrum cordatum]|uniref:ATP-dependent transporter ycf16 n=1 Tax=Prorocentrum cordatum TaxID=2364126 RepID=A0ABN9QB75_9DINO|nr:unnamed protein product [Polarella glacialis]